jgi:thioredoxin 1
MSSESKPAEPTRAEVDQLSGATVLEFGASWCPLCKAARPLVDSALAARSGIRHLWIEDGKGQPLGRSFRVKLWPTLIFLRDGHEVGRVVRPNNPADLAPVFALLQGAR